VAQREARKQDIHTNPFGVIPPKSKPNKWRLILNLSTPCGQSVNDRIEKELMSLSYVSVDDIVDRQGAATRRRNPMAKIDIRRAYQNIPVHSND